MQFSRIFRSHRADEGYLRIAMPAALEGSFMIALSAADIIMVGALGVTAIAAVSIFSQPRLMLLVFARSIAAALTLLVAQCIGAGRAAEARQFLRQTLFTALLLFFVLHVVFFVYLGEILSWMGAAAYLDLALTYGYAALFGVFLTSVTTVLQAYLLGQGQTHVVLMTNVWGNVVNVACNALFIYGLGPFPALGVLGAGIGTVIGTAWTLFHTLCALWDKRVLCGRYLPNLVYGRAFFPIVMGVFSEQGFERVGMVLYTRMVAEISMGAYAVHAVCMNFCDFYYQFAGGLGKASMVQSGQAHGAGDPLRWRSQLFEALRWGFFFSCIAFCLTALLREPIFQIYTADASLLPMGTVILLFVAVVSFPEAHQLIAAGALRGVGMTTHVAVYSFVSIVLLRPLLTAFFLYVLNMGLVGAWCALAIDQFLRAGAASALLWRYARRQQRIAEVKALP